jgi:hypothetical protein
MNTWNCSKTFLNSGSDIFNDPISGKKEKLLWHFFALKSNCAPIAIYGCSLNGWTLSSHGVGTAKNPQIAARIAFAEAWERLWYHRAKIDKTICPILPQSSNGFASGASADDALERARMELCE